MGFGAEMKDFVSAFEATSAVGQKISDRRAKIDKTRGPTQEELDAMSGPGYGGGAIPQVSTDRTTTGSTAKLGNRGGGAFGQQAYDYYRNVGLSHPHAAGIAANLMTESGGDPRVLSGARSGDAGKSYYAAQWQGPRLDNLMSFTRDRGRTKPTLQDQLDFVLEEGKPDSPYKDDGAVTAFKLASQARTPEAATQLYRTHYERPSANDLSKRLGYLSGITDNGNYAAASAAMDSAAPAAVPPTGAIPDGSADMGGGGQPPADPNQDQYSPAAGIDVAPVDMSQDQGAVPQVAAWDQQLYAAGGGMIPAPHYAPGGAVDPYNPARAYTQALPVAPTNGFVPRRVGDPSRMPIPTGPTPSQLAFRHIRPITDPVEKLPTPPPVTPSQRVFATYMPPVSSGGSRGTKTQPQRQTYYTIDPKTSKRVPYMGTFKLDPANQWLVQDNPKGQQPWIPQPLAFAQGGAIPEVNFANGGSVSRDARFQELLQHESRLVGGGGGTSARDRAAMRLSREEGRATSSAYSARNDESYWAPAKPRSTSASAPKGTGKKGDKHKGKNKTATATAAAPLVEDRATRARSTGAGPLAAELQDRAPAAAAAAPPPSVAAAAPGAIPAPSRAAEVGAQVGAMVGREPMGPPMPPPPEPMGGGVTRGPTPPPFGDLGAKHSASADRQRALLQAKFPNNPIVGAMAAPPGTPMIVVPAPPLPNNAPGTGHSPTEIPQVDPMRVEQGAVPAQAPSAWLYGQEVAAPRFAQGGAIPERQSWHAGAPVPGVNLVDPGTQTPTSQEQDTPPAPVQPTKKLRDHVAIALDGGVKFLTSHFGLNPSGAIATPQDGGRAQAGAQRFAQGEGQSTPEEIQGVDNKIDPNRQLSEGQRQMTRLAKTMDWYLQQGRPKDAQAAAASLMQYGATRFSRLGSLAAAAYDEYQQTGDQKHLQHTINFLENAYEMIPDGARMDVAIDPQSKTLVATHIDAEGNEQQFDISPQEIPALIKSVQDKSSYWQSVFQLADPAGARQQAGFRHSAAVKREDRAYNASQSAIRDQRTAARADATANRIDARQAAREKSAEERAIAREGRQSSRKDVNWETVNPLQQAADAAKNALTDDPATQTALDQAASKLWDALPPAANRAQLMKDMGFDKAEWTYSQAAAAETPPEPGAKKAPDGNWYKPDPARAGKWIKLEPAG